MCCSSTQRRRAFAGRHVFVLKSSSGLRGHKRTYLTILESADHALFKMVRYVLLRPLWPELDAKTKTCLAEGELSSRLDEQAKSHPTPNHPQIPVQAFWGILAHQNRNNCFVWFFPNSGNILKIAYSK
jgi:hypothetical protein